MAHVFAVVSSLVNNCLETIANNVSFHEEFFDILPGDLKDKLLKKLSVRGRLKDCHLNKLLHSKVRSLDLSSYDVSDEGLTHVSACHALVNLNLNADSQPRTNITSVGVINVARSCVNLHTVFLRRCVNIRDDVVVALATYCPNLTNLNFGGCFQLTDNSLLALARHSCRLESLNMSHTQISDVGLVALANGRCQHALKEMHFSHCADVSDVSVMKLVEDCDQLHILIFHGCPRVTEMSRDALDIVQRRGSKQLSWTVY